MDQYSYLQSHIGPYNNYMDPGLNDKTNENNKLYFMGAQQPPPPQQGHQQIMPQTPQHQQLEGGPVIGTPEAPFRIWRMDKISVTLFRMDHRQCTKILHL